ncbi:hypothetical protein ABKN59_008281 [Abortiporus biennis]
MRSSIFKAFVFASIFFGLASAVAIPESASDVDDAESLKVDGGDVGHCNCLGFQMQDINYLSFFIDRTSQSPSYATFRKYTICGRLCRVNKRQHLVRAQWRYTICTTFGRIDEYIPRLSLLLQLRLGEGMPIKISESAGVSITIGESSLESIDVDGLASELIIVSAPSNMFHHTLPHVRLAMSHFGNLPPAPLGTDFILDTGEDESYGVINKILLVKISQHNEAKPVNHKQLLSHISFSQSFIRSSSVDYFVLWGTDAGGLYTTQMAPFYCICLKTIFPQLAIFSLILCFVGTLAVPTHLERRSEVDGTPTVVVPVLCFEQSLPMHDVEGVSLERKQKSRSYIKHRALHTPGALVPCWLAIRCAVFEYFGLRNKQV